jgi:hypothetical protein
MCSGAVGTHIFFGSAMGRLELKLGNVATRAGGALICKVKYTLITSD